MDRHFSFTCSDLGLGKFVAMSTLEALVHIPHEVPEQFRGVAAHTVLLGGMNVFGVCWSGLGR